MSLGLSCLELRYQPGFGSPQESTASTIQYFEGVLQGCNNTLFHQVEDTVEDLHLHPFEDIVIDGTAMSQKAPLSLREAVLSRDENHLHDNQVSPVAPLSLREAVLKPLRNRNYQDSWPRTQLWAEPVDIPGYPIEGRPFLDTMPTWVQQLRQGVFHDQATIEQREDGPVLCLMTWYLHGARQRTCAAPRVVQFDLYYEYWENIIREARIDLIDAGQELDAHLVYPEPPRTSRRTHSGHLIIVQDQLHHERAFLLSAFFRDYRDNQLLQRAMFTDRAITATDIQRLSDQQHLCRRYGCTVFYDDVILDDNWHWLHDGSSIIQYVEAHPGGPRRTWSGEFNHDWDDESDAESYLSITQQTDPLNDFLNRSAHLIYQLRTSIANGHQIVDSSDVITLMGRNPVLVRRREEDAIDIQQHIEQEEIPDCRGDGTQPFFSNWVKLIPSREFQVGT